MPIYKREGSDVWQIEVNVPGHPRVRRSSRTTDREKALAIEAKIRHELFQRPVLSGKTWGAAVLMWCRRAERSDSDLYSLGKFASYFGDCLIENVTRENVDKALSFCKTASTYNRYRALIQAVLNVAKEEGWITSLPKLVRKEVKPKPRKWIRRDQWPKLYAALPDHQKPPVEFSLHTGLRRANVLGLTWDRVDIERRVAWIEASETKAGKLIVVPLNDRATEILRKLHPEEGEPIGHVFTYRGKPVGNLKKGFKAACIRAGLGTYDEHGHYSGLTWHGLRHTWATWHVQNNTPLGVLQKLGAWADLRMVMNYAHHSVEYLTQFVNNNTTNVIEEETPQQEVRRDGRDDQEGDRARSEAADGAPPEAPGGEGQAPDGPSLDPAPDSVEPGRARSDCGR